MGGGGKKRGMENLTNETPPKKVFGPLSYGTFSAPLRCQYSVFPVQKSTTEQTRSSFGGVQNFRESAFSGTFSSPHAQSPDLPYPMVWPLPRPWSETRPGLERPIFGFGLEDPAPKG